MKKTFILLIIGIAYTSFVFAQNKEISPVADTLNINNVEAMVFSDGKFFLDTDLSWGYRIPKGSQKSTINSLSLWLGGFDENDTLHGVFPRYFEDKFMPGPIVDVSIPDDTLTANLYNKIWKIDRLLIEEFKQEWQSGNVSNGTYSIPTLIETWPGNHPSLSLPLAPFVDLNQDGIYNPLDGDYPDMMGDQMLWWVFNDNTTKADDLPKAMGIEVRASFYAYSYSNPLTDSLDIINNTSFLNFEIVNRANTSYDSTFIGLFTDFEIGYPTDDYIGCHVDHNSFYGYNGSAIDGNGQAWTYGGPTPPPPAQSVTLLRGPEADEGDLIDNDRDGTVDNDPEYLCLTNFVGSSMGEKEAQQSTQYELYNAMQSIISNAHIQYPTIDSNLVNIETDYMFPADSDPKGWGQDGVVMPAWSELTFNNTPCNRTALGSSGPFTFSASEIISIDYALSFSWSDTGSTFSSVNQNISDVETILQWYHGDGFPSNFLVGVESIGSAGLFNVYPNPASDKILISVSNPTSVFACKLYSSTGQLMQELDLNQDLNPIDVSDFHPGTYILRASGKDEVWVEKFVVVR